MLAKVLSLVREKLRRVSAPKVIPEEDVIDDPIVELVLQIDDKGNFAIGAECFSTQEDHSAFLGMTLYLINNGMLSDYFVESLRLCSEGDEAKLKFVKKAMECWKELYDGEDNPDVDTNRDAVDPRDVFSFHQMRP